MSQTIHDPLKEYVLIIRDLTSVSGQIARVEETKAAAVSAQHHEVLDDCIQEEQALLLKLRGLEQHRIKLQETLGWPSLTLRQILETASPNQAEALAPAFEELDRQLRRLQNARESAERILKVRLHEMEIFSQQGIPYDNSGHASQTGVSQGNSRIRSTYV